MAAFEKDPAYPFLALDKKKLLEEAPPYDAKTSCWIPDEKQGYIRANIVATKGDDVTVKTEKNEVRCLDKLTLRQTTFLELRLKQHIAMCLRQRMCHL
jgi:myosin heavy chain 6/7